ncbi:MAG: serine hydrolase [Bacteroidota bacterium]
MKKKLLWVLVALIALITISYFCMPYYVQRALIYQKPNIDDYKIFDNREIKNSNPIPWNKSVFYCKSKIDKSLREKIESFKTAAFVVVQNDSILYEEYWDGYNEQTISNSFSVAKSVVSLLIGIAVDEKKISSINDPIFKYLPDFPNLKNDSLTIRNVLKMSSGLDWNEEYAALFSPTTKAYYGKDLIELIKGVKVSEKPGVVFRYLSINTQILALVVEKATGKPVSKYAEEKIWSKIGAEHDALWSVDKKEGMEKAYCCFNSTAKDFARIGKLILNKGKWNNQQIVSEKYILESTTASSDLKDKDGKKVDFYGYQWWYLNYKGLKIPYARGILGQYIFVIPEKNAVVVRLGHERSSSYEGSFPSDILMYLETALTILK